MTARQYQVPPQLEAMLLEFTVNVLISQPADLAAFAARYFSRLRTGSVGSVGACNQLSPGDRSGSRRGSAASDHSSVFSEDEAPPQSTGIRRKSVFAEAYNPEDDDDEGDKVVHPKSDVQRVRLAEAVRNIFLFRSLDPMQMQEVLDAMFERKVTPGESVIDQGDDGDNFYVIESGQYSIYVQPDGAAAPKKVGGYDSSGSFGELALMYNLPRAATIQADTDGSLWAMDRQTFRRIVLKSAFKKRKMYEKLLETVPMLKTLEPYERMNLADALVPQTFRNGEIIIEQGDDADGMYFVEDGTVRIMRAEHNQEERQISTVKKGGYLGELALLTNRPRAASAYAVGEVKLAFLDREAFERLLGPCMDVMKREMQHYETELQKVFGTDVQLDEPK